MNWKGFREDMKEIRGEERGERRRVNVKAIEESGLFFRIVNNGESFLFRDVSRRITSADFFPSSGRWTSGGKTYSGGAEKFLAWWKGGE